MDHCSLQATMRFLDNVDGISRRSRYAKVLLLIPSLINLLCLCFRIEWKKEQQGNKNITKCLQRDSMLYTCIHYYIPS